MLEKAGKESRLSKLSLHKQIILNNGMLKRDTTCMLQSLIIYHATRVGINMQSKFRSNRRAYFADNNWTKYRTLI